MRGYKIFRPAFLLAAAVGLVLVIGFQTFAAVRAQRRTVDRVLRDHAETAAWTLEQRLGDAFHEVLECGFHYTLHTARIADELPIVPSAARVRESFASTEDCAHLEVPVPAWVARVLPGPEMDVAGDAPPEALRHARRLLRDGVGEQRPIGRNHYLLAVSDAGAEILTFARSVVPGGFGYWVVPVEASVVGGILDRACATQALLPPTVWPPEAAPDLLPVTLYPGGSMYGEFHEVPVVSASRGLPPEFGGLMATVHVSPAAAAILAPESAAGSSLPLLAFMLALSLALLALAYHQLRRQHELSRLRSDFVSSVSHELRTPLALQRIFLDTIRLGRANDPERLSWALESMDREGLRLEHLVNNILQFARSERGTLDLEPVPTDLGEAVERVVASFQPLARASGAEILLRTGPGIRVALDRGAFQQALANVLENALKYGPDGQTVEVTVSADGEEAVVTVRDQGPGVPPDEREAVFARFRRGRAAVGTSVAGSGIGLSVVRDVLRGHHGTAGFEDSPTGARVRLGLPLSSAAIDLPRPAASHETRSYAGGE